MKSRSISRGRISRRSPDWVRGDMDGALIGRLEGRGALAVLACAADAGPGHLLACFPASGRQGLLRPSTAMPRRNRFGLQGFVPLASARFVSPTSVLPGDTCHLASGDGFDPGPSKGRAAIHECAASAIGPGDAGKDADLDPARPAVGTAGQDPRLEGFRRLAWASAGLRAWSPAFRFRMARPRYPAACRKSFREMAAGRSRGRAIAAERQRGPGGHRSEGMSERARPRAGGSLPGCGGSHARRQRRSNRWPILWPLCRGRSGIPDVRDPGQRVRPQRTAALAAGGERGGADVASRCSRRQTHLAPLRRAMLARRPSIIGLSRRHCPTSITGQAEAHALRCPGWDQQVERLAGGPMRDLQCDPCLAPAERRVVRHRPARPSRSGPR